MMKKLLVAAMLLAATGSVMATESSVTLSADSKLVDTGSVLRNGATVGLDIRFDDVLLDGVFVRTDFDTFTSLTPVNGGIRLRSDLSTGYAGDFGQASKWEVSVARTLNPVITTSDYTEVRGRVKSGVLVAEISQGLTTDVNKDTYLAVGLEQTVGSITTGVLASTVRYNTDGVGLVQGFEFNNVEAFAKWNAWRNLDAQINYSHGGNDRYGNDLGNVFWGGLSYRF